jgi:hypothetical protein
MKHFLSLFLALSSPSFGAVFTFVQSANVANTTSVTCAGSVTAGHLLVLIGGGYDSQAARGATDTLGNTYTQVGQSVNGTGGLYMFYTISGSSGADTVTVGNAGNTNMVLICAEYSGPANFLLLQSQFISWNDNTLNTYTIQFPFATSGSPTAPSEIMAITGWFDENSAHGWTMSNGTKRLDTNPGGGTSFLYGDYDTTSSPLSTIIGTFNYPNGTTTSTTLFLTTISGGGGGSSPVGFVAQ